MECSQIDLYEFLTDSELQQYYNVIKNELKITNAAQFKYATDEDLKHIGLSRPEIRRLRKYYEKHFPHGYLSKIKRLLQAPATMVKRDDGNSILSSHSSLNTATANEATNAANGSSAAGTSPNKVPINKHIIPADSISVNKQLGTGEFGIVQQGVWSNGTERIQVAIKCLCRERMQSNPMEFLKEAAIMHSIEHENIVRLYGVVLATDSLMLVTELAHLRSLLECLKDSGLRVSFLTVPTLCEFAMQICNGMSYLENKRLIHRDLAARNILVFSKNKVKISDFGLSRALGVGKDYYKTNFNVNLKLPIAWCAAECINYLRFTNASDVWAYGVCLWEMFSYGFQPWAALTGLQILEAIDAPNYQRLEQPDCCPQEYYTLMMKCWQDDPLKRPKFSEIYEMLPDMKPEQLKAVVNSLETKNDQLSYRQGDIITVLDRNTGTPFWKGVLNTGKTGFFNPSNTVAYLEGLPSSNRDSFCRSHERSSKRKLRTEMISKPQNDFKHTGHVGIDGASFGDIAFLGNSQSYNHVPRQIVTPYKPSEDIEQTPLLLPPTPTSPDSMQSGYFADGHHPSTSVNPSFVSSTENTPKQQSSFQFPHYNTSSSNNPFSEQSSEELQGIFAMHNKNYGLERKCFTNTSASLLGEGEGTDELNWRSINRQQSSGDEPHEYHEISDDEMTADKLDLGPSLLDEINSMFGSMSAGNASNTATSVYQPKTPDFDQINIKNEFAEITSKLANNKNNGHLSKKKSGTGTVKPISVKDEKILNQAIEIANEISARSMNDLVSDPSPATQSPKRKFSFRFPHLSKDVKTDNPHNHGSTGHSAENDVQAGASSSPYSKKKNFSEELKSIPDLQRFRSLSEIKGFSRSDIRIPLFDKETSDFCFEKSREILSRPLKLETAALVTPPSASENNHLNENILDIEKTLKALNLDFMHNYTELYKTDSDETILNERFSSLVSGTLDDEIGSTGSPCMQAIFDFNAATNHLDKHLQLINSREAASAASIFSNTPTEQQKLQEDKRSSTPDTGFASRDTNMSLSRRSSQKSSYSPQENYFNFSGVPSALKEERFVGNKSPLKTTTATTTVIQSKHAELFVGRKNPNKHRERSMSFNDKFSCISPVLSEPQQRIKPHAAANQALLPETSRLQLRRTASYKPRTARARTLRRLSYNPLTLASSSSTSSSEGESETNYGIARSECDIRMRVSNLYQRQRRQRKIPQAPHPPDYEGRQKVFVHNNKLYGSNVSIKSAPHYNLASRHQSTTSSAMRNYANSFAAYEERIYDFGLTVPTRAPMVFAPGVCAGSGSSSTSAASTSALATKFNNARETSGLPNVAGNLNEFDVSRLTGKSPTSGKFVNNNNSSPEQRQKRIHPSPPNTLPLVNTTSNSINNDNMSFGQVSQHMEFHWPEKIHASTVKQNELLWRHLDQRQRTGSDRRPVDSTGSSSSTDSDLEDDFGFRGGDFVPHIPPSPAP